MAELIVALDVPTADEIGPIVDSLPHEVEWYKVGLELFIAAGPAALEPLKKRNKKIFLDLKLHDIPRTVANAVKTARDHNVQLMTLHAGGGSTMLRAGAEAAASFGTDRPALVAVTTLTSLGQEDLNEMGIVRDLKTHTLALGQMAIDSGIDGLVCSTWEAGDFRSAIGREPFLVTPGIRPAGADVGDQKRVATPAIAVQAGSSHLVVGRPILQAEDPAAAAAEILRQIAEAG